MIKQNTSRRVAHKYTCVIKHTFKVLTVAFIGIFLKKPRKSTCFAADFSATLGEVTLH